MKKHFYLVLVSLQFLFNLNESKASHLMGGEILWNNIGQDSFLITLYIFGDCNAATPSGYPLFVKCASTGALYYTIGTSWNNVEDITPVCDTSCTRCQSLSCSFPYGTRKFSYQYVINLSSAGYCCSIKISFQQTYRSPTITTGGANAGFYIESYLNRCLNPADNSPTFSSPPINILCNGKDFIFNYGVQDFDTSNSGSLLDSITYEWIHPMADEGVTINYNSFYSYDKPIYFLNFPNANYAAPSGFHLNPNTGDIQFRPMKAEVTLMVLKVNEFRNGVKIGEIRRDMQIAVINCATNISTPKITTPNNVRSKTVCANSQVSFNFSTSDPNPNDTVTISWNGAIPGATWTTTNGQANQPTATLTWTPTQNQASQIPYTFTVTAKDNTCPIPGLTSIQYSITVLPKPIVSHTLTDSGCGKFLFNSKLIQGSGLSYQWQGQGGINSNKSTFMFQFPKPDMYYYSFTYGVQNYCMLTEHDSIFADTFLWTTKSKDTAVCIDDTAYIWVLGHNNRGPIKYLWSNGDTTPAISVLTQTSKWMRFKVTDTTSCSKIDSIFIKINKRPVININKDTAICLYDSITLKASGGKYYLWSSGDQVDQITKTPLVPTRYKVNVTDSNYCSDSVSVYVALLSIPSIYKGPDDTVCSFNGSVNLHVPPDTINLKNIWIGSFVGLENNQNWYFDASNTGIINLKPYQLINILTDTNGCSNSDTILITVYKTTHANSGTYNNICINGNPIQLNGSPTGGNWIGNGIKNAKFYPDSAGIGTHLLIYSVNDICISIDTSIITVNSLPLVTANTIDGRYKFCPTENLVKLIGNPSGGPYGGYWTGDIVNGSYFSPNKNDGKYLVSYHYTDQNKCENSDSFEITVMSPFVLIDRHQQFVCNNNNIVLSATYWGSDYINWMKDVNANGNFIGNTMNNPITYKPGDNEFTNGGFWIKVYSNSNVCNTTVDSLYINAGYPPIADFVGTSDSNYVPFDVQFTNLSVIPKGSIKDNIWYFGDGDSSKLKNPLHTYLQAGNYNVKLIAISNIGCSDTMLKLNYITAFSGINDDNYNKSIKLYPNPASNYFDIISERKITTVQLYNSIGSQIRTYNKVNSNFLRIERGNMIKGIYLVKVSLNNALIYFGRIVLE
jgi:PKD repeat protein